MKLIDYNKVYENIKTLKKTRKLMLVLKDNAYNFDLIKILEIAISLNVKMFATNKISEAIKMRKFNDKIIILLLGKIPSSIYVLKKYKITLSVNNLYELSICIKNKLFYHLKINTSMNRFGIEYMDMNKYITKYLKGIYLHVPTNNTAENINIVQKLHSQIKKYNLQRLIIHVGGSNILGVNTKYVTRIACAIYEKTLAFYGKIIDIKVVPKNTQIGYNHNYITKEESIIGICNLGYVNGLSRINDNNYVFINNKKYYFIGHTCMDYSFILIDNNVKLFDAVEIIGNNISLEKFCEMNSIIKHQAYLNLK